ncbi:MAG: hypothetical protein ACD_22C00136G0003 [uncultured bacterium]|nr:MAG: hypothetical protein ACD_22C00136G0003 [uncultured bacterium]
MKLFVRIKKNKIEILFFLAIFLFFFGLSLFGCVIGDDYLYLQETLLMSNLIKQGVWFGNYGVGLHGFLFKIPLALVFTVTGPSLLAATTYNIVLATLAAIFFYKLLKALNFGKWAFAGTFLLVTSFEFVRSTPTYLREIPVLLALLLFTYAVIRKKSGWLIGILLMLVLDAKEYVFYAITPTFILWTIFINYSKTNSIVNKTLNTIKALSSYYTPAVILLLAMFTTPYIPLNTFNVSILALNKESGNTIEQNFKVVAATENTHKNSEPKVYAVKQMIEKSRAILAEDSKSSTLLNKTSSVLVLYANKLLYPRTLSFISIPKVIAIPAILMSIYMLFYWLKTKEFTKIGLIAIFWGYFLVYILRTSHARYLFPCVPFIIMFFMYFITKRNVHKFVTGTVFTITPLFVLGGFIFENTYVIEKGISNSIIFLAYCLIFVLKETPKRLLISIVYIVLILSVGGSSLTTALLFSYKLGQINCFLKWGYNTECNKMAQEFNKKDIVWTNQILWAEMLTFYRNDFRLNPQWNWEMFDWIPKKNMLIETKDKRTYFDTPTKMEDFRAYLQINKVDKIAVIKSTNGEYFTTQNWLPDLLTQPWLTLDKKVELKNKVLYVFVINKKILLEQQTVYFTK